ncbi:MAG TPA: hypothetical protein VJH92_01470 [Candidatus Nanoarchaeia archaeon]|nr:hypothetical protein [Candidatus Nanoarchaeia archaeon]
MNPVEYCLNVYIKDVEENPQKLRWYHLTIPLAGPFLYVDANSSSSWRSARNAVTSLVTSTIILPIGVSKAIEYLIR